MEQNQSDAQYDDGFSLPNANSSATSAIYPPPSLQLQASSHEDKLKNDGHESISETSGPIKCPKCPKTLSNRSSFVHHSVVHERTSVRCHKCSKCNSWYNSRGQARSHEVELHGNIVQPAATNYRGGQQVQAPTTINTRKNTRLQLASANEIVRPEPQQQQMFPPLLNQQLPPPLSQPQCSVIYVRDAVANGKSSMSVSAINSGGEQSLTSRANTAPNIFKQINDIVDMCSYKLKKGVEILQHKDDIRINELDSDLRVAVGGSLRQNVVVQIETALTRIAADNGVPYDASASMLGLATLSNNLKVTDVISGLEALESVCVKHINLTGPSAFGPFLQKPGLLYVLSLTKAILNAIEAK